jgi:prevent-host-death family protein
MDEVNISDFKARCLALLEEVARTGKGLTILKRGRPIAIVQPPPRSGYPQMSLFGTVETLGDIVSPVLPESDWECLR